MLMTILLILLILMVLGAAADLGPQPPVGLRPQRWAGADRADPRVVVVLRGGFKCVNAVALKHEQSWLQSNRLSCNNDPSG